MEHLVLAVIEAERIPCRMFAAAVAVKIQVMTAVEPSESLYFVLYSVRVDDIHYYRDTQLVGAVDQFCIGMI